MRDKTINKTSQLIDLITNSHISSFTDLYLLSGIHGIISEKSNAIINHNILEFGKSSILTLDSSKILAVNNDYLTKRIQLIASLTPLTATVLISSNTYNIPFIVELFLIDTTLSRLDNDLYIFKDKDIKYYYTNTYDVDSTTLPTEYQEKLKNEYKVKYTLLIYSHFPSTTIMPDTIITLLSTKTALNGYVVDITTDLKFPFNKIIQPVTGTLAYNECTPLILQIPASGNLINMTSAGLQEFPATGAVPVNGIFLYIDNINLSYSIDGSGNGLLTGNLISSSVTGLMIGPDIISSVITSQVIGTVPDDPSINVITSFLSSTIDTTSSVITGPVLGAAFNLTGTINGGLLNFTVTSGSSKLTGKNNGKIAALFLGKFTGLTDLLTSYVSTQTATRQVQISYILQVITSYVNYMNGLMLVSASTPVMDNVILNGVVLLSTYNLKLNVDYLMNSNTPILFNNTTKTIYATENDIHLTKYPDFNDSYLTTETIINTEATQLFSDNSEYITALSGNTIVDSRGGISNFPAMLNLLTGTLKLLLPLSELSASTLYSLYELILLSGITQSYLGLSQTLITNGQTVSWSNKVNEFYDFISYVSNAYINTDDALIKNSRDIYFVFSNILHVTNSISDDTSAKLEKNVGKIKTFLSKTLFKLFENLNKLPKNFYNRNIHILFNLQAPEDGTIDLDDHTNDIIIELLNTLKLDNLYNCNIYILNLNNKIPIKLICKLHTIFKFVNLDNLYIKNILLLSCFNDLLAYSDTESAFYPLLNINSKYFKKYMQLIYAINIKYFLCNQCVFDNVFPRITKYINNLNILQALLAYPTYALLFINNTKLHLNNCDLRNSNQGVIAYCNSLVQYSGNTNLMFKSMQWFKKNDTFLSGTFTRIIDELPVLKSDYEQIADKILNYDNTGIYFTYLPIINYLAGNSLCNMIPDSNKNIISEYVTNDTTIPLPSSIMLYTLSGLNFTLGLTQIGSIFNHTHKNLIDDDNNTMSQRLKSILDILTRIPEDPCIGMTNLQLPLNQFLTNNASKSIGYAYNGLTTNNDVYTYNIFTHYVPKEVYTKISMFYRAPGNEVLPFLLTSYSTSDIMCLPDSSAAIEAKKYSTDYFDGYNNGQFWVSMISGKNIVPNILNPNDYFNFDIEHNLTDIALDIHPHLGGVLLDPSNTIDFLKKCYVYDANRNNIVDRAYLKCIHKFNITLPIIYKDLSGTFFTDENISNVSYVRLIKNYFSNDHDLKYWNAPSIGLLVRPKSYSAYKLNILQRLINISDRYNFQLRKSYSVTAGKKVILVRVDTDSLNVIAARTGATNKLETIPADKQICNGLPVFSFVRNTGITALSVSDLNNIKNKLFLKTPVLASTYPQYTIIPKVNSKYDLNLPIPKNTPVTAQINSQPLNYETIVPPFEFYNIPKNLNDNMYNTVLSSDATTATAVSDIPQLNGVKYMDYTNYLGNSKNFVYYTKINNAVIIPSFGDTNGELLTLFEPLISSNLLVNEYLNITGKYKVPLLNINKFKQDK